jgi:RHS repeat-associated protein
VKDYRYSFNPVTGNLNSRQNYLLSKSESFTYDNLDRLKTVTGPQNLSMDYNPNGNITEKSDVGNVFGYTHPTKPYALTGIETSTGLVPEALQTVIYTSFEQPLVITESPYQATFTYNSEGQRAKMEVKQSGSTILTRWYAGSRYIKETEGANTKQYTWIGGDAYTAPCVAVKTNTGAQVYYYLLRDYLGNITHQLDMSNNVVAEYTFGAWGRRRDKDTWSYTLGGEPTLLTGRGFTEARSVSPCFGEHSEAKADGRTNPDELCDIGKWLPWFNLYNMNGRLYDPVVGRFLSADNYVQMPGFSQSFNRYSYALNNPLVYTDPDGEFIFTALAVLTGQLWALPITIGADFGAVTGGIRGAQDPNVGFWKGAGRGALVGSVGGGLSMIGGAGMPFVANLAIGTGSGALTGGLDAALWGNDIGEGMLWGAAAGAVFTTITSENFSNALKGEGFYTNENVFNNMIERGMDKQAMLDYFGFEGTYTGTTKGPSYIDGGGEGASFYGSTNPKTGSIKYGDLAFDSYDKLKMTYNKEMYHSLRVKNGIPLETQGTELGKHLKYYPEERLGFIHAYKNQGLYPSAGKGLMSNISYYQMQSFNLNPSQYYSAKWWHFIYKIPRRW